MNAGRVKPLHDWDLGIGDAVALQKELAGRVSLSPLTIGPRLIAGADVAVSSGGSLRFTHGRSTASATPTQVFAVVVVWDAMTGGVVEKLSHIGETRFPYVPGLLSFREAPTLLDAFARLETRPDAVILDGNGFAHLRRCVLA